MALHLDPKKAIISTEETEDVALAQILFDAIAASSDHAIVVTLNKTGMGFVITFSNTDVLENVWQN